MITEGWYVPAPPLPTEERKHRFARWVLGEIDGKVCYSKGGTDHYFCKPSTFLNWCKRAKATRQTRAQIEADKGTP